LEVSARMIYENNTGLISSPEKIIVRLFLSSDGSGSQITPDVLQSSESFNDCERTMLNEAESRILSTKEQLNHLRQYIGFNISELSDILQVKRPTIYEWLNGHEPSKKKQQRLDNLYELLSHFFNKNTLPMKGFIYRTLDRKNLFLLLKQDNLNEEAIKEMLQNIQRSLINLKEEKEKHDEKLKKHGFSPISLKQKEAFINKIIRKIE